MTPSQSYLTAIAELAEETGLSAQEVGALAAPRVAELERWERYHHRAPLPPVEMVELRYLIDWVMGG